MRLGRFIYMTGTLVGLLWLAAGLCNAVNARSGANNNDLLGALVPPIVLLVVCTWLTSRNSPAALQRRQTEALERMERRAK